VPDGNLLTLNALYRFVRTFLPSSVIILWVTDYILPDMSSYDDGDYDDDDDEDSNNDHDIPDDESLKHFNIQEPYLGSPDEVKDDATNAFSKGDPTFNCVSIPSISGLSFSTIYSIGYASILNCR